MNMVLAHGILGFKELLGIDYFNGINKHLEDKFQANVLVTTVDATKGVEYRGKQLRKQILDALRITEVKSHT